jgi:hypothetical protein
MAEYPKDCHDYVFQDRKVVAKFEEMYRHSETVPWHQDEQEDWVDVRLTIEFLRDIGPFEELHNLGCGLGNYLALMRSRLGAPECSGFGYDIAETACAKAKLSFPEFSFQTLDLTRAAGPIASTRKSAATTSKLFMIRGTLWYVFPHMVQVVRTIRSLMLSRITMN